MLLNILQREELERKMKKRFFDKDEIANQKEKEEAEEKLIHAIDKMNKEKPNLLHPTNVNIIGGFNKMELRVKVHTEWCVPWVSEKGDWIDLSTSREYILKMGSFTIIDLGVSIRLPEHIEAHLVPRSSTFKKYGIIQTNGIGVIDSSYSGDNDVWGMPVYATRDIVIPKGVRIAQFRIFANQPAIDLKMVDSLGGTDRGGFGSTGD
jgi:dUTP pyrophosphatase